MQTVNNRNDLKKSTDRIVFVKSIRTLFVRDNDEWIIKEYFTFHEAITETKLKKHELVQWSDRFRLGGNKRKYTLSELQKLIKIKKLRVSKMRLSEIAKIVSKSF
jgi:hypothetical protein